MVVRVISRFRRLPSGYEPDPGLDPLHTSNCQRASESETRRRSNASTLLESQLAADTETPSPQAVTKSKTHVNEKQAQNIVSDKENLLQPEVAFGLRVLSQPPPNKTCDLDILLVRGPNKIFATWYRTNVPNKTTANASKDAAKVGASPKPNVPPPRTNQKGGKDVEQMENDTRDAQNRMESRLAGLVKTLQDLGYARVLAFTYDEPDVHQERLSLDAVSTRLSKQLHAVRVESSDRPIMFVGHDFGVTVIERCLVHCVQDTQHILSICQATIGLIALLDFVKQLEKVKKLSYFDSKSPSSTWMNQVARPCAEFVGIKRVSQWIQHLEKFEKTFSGLSRSRPAMVLLRSPSNTFEGYSKLPSLIADALRAYRLLDAAQRADSDRIQVLLDEGYNMNVQDSLGQSALHLAVRCKNVELVRFLLARRGVDASIQDFENNNALHYAAMYCSESPEVMNSIVIALVDQGAKLEASDSKGLTAKEAARLAGVPEDSLIKRTPWQGPLENPDPERKPPKQPRSKEAIQACHDCLAIVAEFYVQDKREQMIIQYPSVHELLYDSNSSPEQILKAVRCPTIVQKPQCTWYHLPVNHLGWVTDLFGKMGISPSEPLEHDQHDGEPYWSLYMRPQARLFDSIRRQQDGEEGMETDKARSKDFVLYMPYLNFERRCDHFEINMMMKSAEARREKEFRKARQLKQWLSAMIAQMNEWKVRIEDAKENEGKGQSGDRTESEGGSDGEAASLSMASTKKSQKAKTVSRRVTFDIRSALHHDAPVDENAQLDSLRAFDPEEIDLTQIKTTYEATGAVTGSKKPQLDTERNLALGYHATKPAVLHQRRTLDQSHYFMLEDTSERDHDQVVLRNARRSKEAVAGQDDDPSEPAESEQSDLSNSKQHSRSAVATDCGKKHAVPTPPNNETHPMVMVDQLWIWVIGNTVVTSFPQKWKDAQYQRFADVKDALVKHLQEDKKRPPVLTAHDLAHLIIKYCVSVFNRRLPGPWLDLHDIFEMSVGHVADEQMKLFRNFEKDAENSEMSDKELRGLYKNADLRENLDKIFSIKEEIKVLDEIKDIRDELNMILRVLNDQCLAFADMMSILQPEKADATEQEPGASTATPVLSVNSLTEEPHELAGDNGEGHRSTAKKSQSTIEAVQRRHRSADVTVRQRIIDANTRDFERMLNHVDNSYNELNHLLDLKQKQANALEARLSRMGAESGARQSTTIMVFTIASIFFGSLSFVTAFFALNVSAYPGEWHLGAVTGYIAAVSVGLMLPFFFSAFSIPLAKLIAKWGAYMMNGLHWKEVV